jgi:hypothetical protein
MLYENGLKNNPILRCFFDFSARVIFWNYSKENLGFTNIFFYVIIKMRAYILFFMIGIISNKGQSIFTMDRWAKNEGLFTS